MDSLDSIGPELHLPGSRDPLAELGLSYVVLNGKGNISIMDCIDIVLGAINLPGNEQEINLDTGTCYASIQRRGPDRLEDLHGQRYFAKVITHQGQYQGPDELTQSAEFAELDFIVHKLKDDHNRRIQN